jgi:hypothetical protein
LRGFWHPGHRQPLSQPFPFLKQAQRRESQAPLHRQVVDWLDVMKVEIPKIQRVSAAFLFTSDQLISDHRVIQKYSLEDILSEIMVMLC